MTYLLQVKCNGDWGIEGYAGDMDGERNDSINRLFETAMRIADSNSEMFGDWRIIDEESHEIVAEFKLPEVSARRNEMTTIFEGCNYAIEITDEGQFVLVHPVGPDELYDDFESLVEDHPVACEARSFFFDEETK